MRRLRLPEPSRASLVCAATATNRAARQDNQDCFAVVTNEVLGLRAVVVADGLGSFSHARLAANTVVKSVKQQFQALTTFHTRSFQRIFRVARDDLVGAARQFGAARGETVDPEASFATTLIVAVEGHKRLHFAYVGNGAIWHLRGNFNKFHKSKYLPWNSLNYLNPQSVQNEHGKEALYKLISLDDDSDRVMPTVFEVAKDELFFGDAFMVCTDGISSSDQVRVGKAPDGSIWISGEARLAAFYRHLDAYFTVEAEPTEESLQGVLGEYLDELRAEHLLEDDATLGVIVTPKAIEYQRKYRARRAASILG